MASNEFARGDRYKQAIVLFEEALKIHTKLNDLGMKAQDLNDMGACYRYLGEYKKAEGLFNKALDLNQLIGNRRLEAFNTCNIAGALFAQKQYDLAQSRAEEGCRIGKEVEDKVPQLWGLVWKGLALQGMGEFKTAETSFNECVQLGREMENPRGLAGALGRLGVLLFDELDRADEGKSLIQEAIKILRDHNLKTAFSNITLDELEERLEHTSH